MIYYFLLLCVICFDFFLEKLLSNHLTFDDKKNRFCKLIRFIFKYRLITIFALVVISTLRSYSVGLDTGAYYNVFKMAIKNPASTFTNPFGSKYEVGFHAIVSFLAVLKLNFRFLLFMVSLFFSVCLVIFVNKFSKNKLMSILLYIMLGIFAQSLCIIRQIIALGFVLLAVVQLNNKRWYFSFLYIIFASIFHISALVAILIIPFRFIKLNNYMVVSLIVATIILSLLSPYILKIIDKLSPIDYYEKYYENPKSIVERSTWLNNLYTTGLLLVFMIFFFFREFLKVNKQIPKYYDVFLGMFLFAVLIRIAGFVSGKQELFNRLTVYFFVSLIILIPSFCNEIKSRFKSISGFNIFVYAVGLVYMYNIYEVVQSCGVVPYSFM